MDNIHQQQNQGKQQADQEILKKLIQVLRFQPNFQVIYREKAHSNYISLKNLTQDSNIKFSACIKVKNNGLTLDLFGVGKLQSASQMQNIVFEQHAKKFNESHSKEACVVYWVKSNQNFAARKFIPLETLKDPKLEGQRKYFFHSIQILQQILGKCIRSANFTRSQMSTIQSEQMSKPNNFICNKKLSILEKLKYQFEINRKKRSKASNFDFSRYQLKTLQQFHQFNKLHRNNSYQEQLRKIINKNQINQKEAFAVYDKLAKQFCEKQQQNLFQSKTKQKRQILNAIKIYEQKLLDGESLDSTFAQIQIVQSRFGVIFSVNSKTNNEMEQDQNNAPFIVKEENEILVKKNKRTKSNQKVPHRDLSQSKIVFEIEVETLLLLRSSYHDSICQFYIKQFIDKSEIISLYSKRHPYDSITKFKGMKEKINDQIKIVSKIFKFLTEIAEGIWFLWKMGILHRDLKPGNVVIDAKGQSKIIDFGSAAPVYNGKERPENDIYSTMRSTRNYYSSYNDLIGLIRCQYTRQQYERHEHFDVYALGAITQKMLDNLNLDSYPQLKDNISYFIKKCKDRHPDDRLNPLEASLFLRMVCSYAISLYQSFQK